MQFPRFRFQFTLSENKIKFADISVLGLAILTCYGLYKCNSKRSEEKQKLKRVKYLYTADECQQLQIDSKQITVQGQINNDNQFLLLESFSYEGKIKNIQSRGEVSESFMIVDPYTKTEIIGKIKKDCFFEQKLFNYHKYWTYQTYVSSNNNFIVRLYKKIINYFFGKTIVESVQGINTNQYFIFKGILKKQNQDLMLEIDHVALTPNFIYQQIKKNLEKYLIQECFLVMLGTFVIYYFYKGFDRIMKIKGGQPQLLFKKGEGEVIEDSDLCIACMTNVRNILILPCFHLVCCQECLQKIEEKQYLCPICRTQITQQKQVLIDNIY